MQAASINQLTTFRWTFDEDVCYFQKAGLQAIGVWRRKLQDFGEERAKELLSDAGLEVNCLSWAGGFTGCDGRSLEESIVDGLAAIGAAARIEAKCLIVYTGGRNNHIDSHADRLMRHALDDMLMAAEVAGVTLAIKPLRGPCAGDWTYLTDLDSAIDLANEYKSPNLKLVYDCYQFPELVEQPGTLKRLLPYLGLVQLGDARIPHSIEQDRCLLGDGVVPVAETVAVLMAAGYNGPLDIELMGSEIEASDYHQLVAATHQTLNTYLESSRQSALEFTGARPL